MNNIDNLIEIYKIGKLGHSYLIETNNEEQAIKDLEKLIIILLGEPNKLIINNNPNYIYIEPDGKNIKKEQIAELKRKLSFKPYLSNNNVFVVKGAEKLSPSSSNSMLKLLEEPETNTYGFLITNNLENIILTIKSRCQILRINYENDVIKFIYLDLINEYVKAILISKEEGLLNNLKLKEFLVNKEETVVFLKEFLYILTNVSKVSSKEKELLKYLSKKQKVMIETILINCLERINYNVNIELLLDKLTIEMSGIND